MEAIEHILETPPVSAQVHRLLRSGRVNASTTFGQLDEILAQDDREQAAVRAIKAWFTSDFDRDHFTVEEGEFAVDAMLCWFVFDQDDFEKTFSA